MASSTKVIGTHSGTFHCDEALACFMLKLTDTFKDAKIVRSRDMKVLEKCDILVDVGSVYDPKTLRFDHHQRGFDETFSENHNVKLSSAGLVYKHYGYDVVQKLVGSDSKEDTEKVYQKIYRDFIEGIDGIDNGVSQYPKDAKKAYSVGTDLSSRVGHLNPMWNEPSDDSTVAERFDAAMQMAGAEFVSVVTRLAKSWLPAREIVKNSLADRLSVHPSGRILRLQQFTVWKEHLDNLEVELKVDPLTLYVLYEDTAKCWRIQCVAVAPGSFDSRKALPEPWRGIRDADLEKVTGVTGATFVHATGFIGGAKTYDAALEMAIKSMEFGVGEESEAKKQKV